MADNSLLPSLFEDNRAYQPAWDQARNWQPSITNEQLEAARADADAAFGDLSTAPTIPADQTIAASIAAALPALFGGITHGSEGAGWGGEGAVAAIKDFQARSQKDIERQQEASRLGYEKKQRGYETLLSLAQREREKNDENVNSLLMAGGKDASDSMRAEAQAENQREIQRMQDENELLKIDKQNEADQITPELSKILEEKFGVPIPPGTKFKLAEDMLTADDKAAGRSNDVLKMFLEDKAKADARENARTLVADRGLQTRLTLEEKKKLSAFSGAEQEVIANASRGKLDFSGIDNPEVMKLASKVYNDNAKLGQQDRKLDQADIKLKQADRGLDIRDKSVTGTLADKAVGRELQARELGLKEADVNWQQDFKLQQEKRIAEAQNRGLDIQERRLLAQNNAQAFREKQFTSQATTPEGIAAAAQALRESGASDSQIAILSSERTQKGLDLAMGEIRRQVLQQKQIAGEIKKPLPAKAVEAFAQANTVQDVLDNAYKVIDQLDRESWGNPAATFTAQQIMGMIGPSDRAIAAKWLTMDGMRLLYTQSGKQINETEAKLFTDFFAGSSAIAVGDLKQRFNELARSAYTNALSQLDAGYLYAGTRAGSKELAKKLAKRAPSGLAGQLVSLRPNLFTSGDE